MNRYFSVMRFEGEQNLPPEDDHLFSNQDYRMFLSYIHGTIIEVGYICINKCFFRFVTQLPPIRIALDLPALQEIL